MNNKKNNATRFRNFLAILVCLACVSQEVYGIFAVNLFRPWDINLRPCQWECENVQLTGWGEWAIHVDGYNKDADRVNPLQIWSRTQNSIAMLKGFPEDSPMSQFLQNTLGNPTDDGVRGHFITTGDVGLEGYGVSARYHAPHNFTFGLHLPVYRMKLNNICFIDQTKDITMEDMTVKEELTSQLFEVVNQFDPTLDFSPWKRAGLGDMVAMVEWYRNFPQMKPILKNVSLNARFGLSLPTGLTKDENRIFSIPFGFDGAAGIVFGGGINLNWGGHVRGGIDIEFINIFGNTRDRRIKVYEGDIEMNEVKAETAQTEFLFLAKAPAYKDFGFTHRFNLFLEAYRVWGGLSFRATYQFWKHGEDKISLCTNEYSSAVASTAGSLQEWTMHNFIAHVDYDFQCDVPEYWWFKPQVSFFWKIPFNGQRALLARTVGGTFTLNF